MRLFEKDLYRAVCDRIIPLIAVAPAFLWALLFCTGTVNGFLHGSMSGFEPTPAMSLEFFMILYTSRLGIVLNLILIIRLNSENQDVAFTLPFGRLCQYLSKLGIVCVVSTVFRGCFYMTYLTLSMIDNGIPSPSILPILLSWVSSTGFALFLDAVHGFVRRKARFFMFAILILAVLISLPRSLHPYMLTEYLAVSPSMVSTAYASDTFRFFCLYLPVWLLCSVVLGYLSHSRYENVEN